jgi:hypothetical protein
MLEFMLPPTPLFWADSKITPSSGPVELKVTACSALVGVMFSVGVAVGVLVRTVVGVCVGAVVGVLVWTVVGVSVGVAVCVLVWTVVGVSVGAVVGVLVGGVEEVCVGV